MSLWESGEIIAADKMNMKDVYIGTTAPPSPTDGMIWVDTSVDPPAVKEYDETGAAWRELERTDRKNQASGYAGLDASARIAEAQLASNVVVLIDEDYARYYKSMSSGETLVVSKTVPANSYSKVMAEFWGTIETTYICDIRLYYGGVLKKQIYFDGGSDTDHRFGFFIAWSEAFTGGGTIELRFNVTGAASEEIYCEGLRIWGKI